MSRPAISLAVLFAIAACHGCKKDQGEAAVSVPPAANAAPAKSSGGGGTGSIKGTIKLSGTPPARETINMKADPYCAKAQAEAKDDEVVVGAGNGLKNVVVRVAQGLSEKYTPKAEEAVMDQQGCMYRPRVLVAQAGQVVLIKNSDQTLHNIHTYKGPTTLFNQAEVFGMPPIRKKFPGSGDVVKFKCDVHPWMTAYLLVTDNPFYAITAEDGSFTIPEVPAGTYTVEVWHERLGTQKKELTVATGKPAELNLELAAK
jgi:plastocyanin